MMQRQHFNESIQNIQDETFRLACTQTFDTLKMAVLALNTLFGEERGSFSASDAIAVASMIKERLAQLEAEEA